MSEFEDALLNQRPNCMSGLGLAESKEKRFQSRIVNRTKELEGCCLLDLAFISHICCFSDQIIHGLDNLSKEF